MNMPSELKLAVAKAQGQPVEVVDGAERYVLIRAEMFERLKAVLDLSEPGPQERKASSKLGASAPVGKNPTRQCSMISNRHEARSVSDELNPGRWWSRCFAFPT